MQRSKKLSWFGDEFYIRADDLGRPWIMNRQDNGWEEYGVVTSWADLLQLDGVEFFRFKDAFSYGVKMVRVTE